MSAPGTVRRSLAESIRLGRERIRRAPRRVLATWLIQALVLLVLGWVLPGVRVRESTLTVLDRETSLRGGVKDGRVDAAVADSHRIHPR